MNSSDTRVETQSNVAQLICLSWPCYCLFKRDYCIHLWRHVKAASIPILPIISLNIPDLALTLWDLFELTQWITFLFFVFFQCPPKLDVFNVWGRGSLALVSNWDGHFLHRLLHRFPILFCQHFRRPGHCHFQRTGRGRTDRRHWQKSGITYTMELNT